jgi:hypothetical protein
MTVQRWARLTGVLLVAASSPAFAQCETAEKSETFVYVAKGGVGTTCTTDHPQSRKFCIPAGKIATYEFDLVEENNMAGTTEVEQLDDQCVEATTTGHAKEASRTQNGWLCSAAERTVLVRISYCR